MTRLLLLVHRYLGIGIGILMVMWCLSGFVMMYVSYPALPPQTRLAHLEPIAWGNCCRVSVQALADSERVSSFRIEMLTDHPLLEVHTDRGSEKLIDLMSGALLGPVAPREAALVAQSYREAPTSPLPNVHAARDTTVATPQLLGLIELDEWTLEGVSAGERPLYRFKMEDPRGTELYVSSTTGRVVQLTTRVERFWNWFGSVPHWLYFTGLRRHAELWSEIVIYTSLAGCFLTIIGIYLGVRQLLSQPCGRWSPYRGFRLWHHLAGLVVGLFTLSWVLSGLLSMNPWGLLEGAGAEVERAQLRGLEPSGLQVKSAVQALAAAHPTGVVAVQSAPLHGRLYLVTSYAYDKRRRLDANGTDDPLDDSQLSLIARTLSARTIPPTEHASAQTLVPLQLQWLSEGDNYYFSHDSSPVRLPVYRLAPVHASGTRYYVDTVSGELLAEMDGGNRGYRWWYQGLHRLDFSAWLRGRPQWDLLVWILLSGVTVVCVTGAYLGYQRLRR